MILEQVDSLVETGRSIGSGEAGHISIGFCTSISAGNLRATLVEFKKRFPRLAVIAIALEKSPRVSAVASRSMNF
jgi:DNA-binding transcriptional LysR family regulator